LKLIRRKIPATDIKKISTNTLILILHLHGQHGSCDEKVQSKIFSCYETVEPKDIFVFVNKIVLIDVLL